jgi:hypothetical protein
VGARAKLSNLPLSLFYRNQQTIVVPGYSSPARSNM